MIERLGKEWAESGVDEPVAVTGDALPAAWNWLTELSADVRIHVRPSGVVAMVERLLSRHPECRVQAHAGNGVIRVGWPPSQLPSAELLCGELCAAVAEAGGTMAVLRHPDGNGLSARDVWGPPGGAAPVMRALKDRFDPQNILNPGRLAFD
jgi:FAD/FMN-containing dehydrogenase